MESAALPLSRLDSAGRPTPRREAAALTDIPFGMTCSRMCAPTPETARLPLDLSATRDVYRVALHNTTLDAGPGRGRARSQPLLQEPPLVGVAGQLERDREVLAGGVRVPAPQLELAQGCVV